MVSISSLNERKLDDKNETSISSLNERKLVGKVDKKMLEKVSAFLNETTTGASRIQIEDFILNDIEYPTNYGKFCQAKTELSHRFSQIVGFYYDIKETEIRIEQKRQKIRVYSDELRNELLKVQIEKLELKLVGIKTQLKVTLKEMQIFYEVFCRCPEFHELSEEEAYKLEREQWIAKTFNMPIVFEERYGERYMREAVGEDCYRRYRGLRRQRFGLLPREIFVQRNNDGEDSCQNNHRNTDTTSERTRKITSTFPFLEKV